MQMKTVFSTLDYFDALFMQGKFMQFFSSRASAQHRAQGCAESNWNYFRVHQDSFLLQEVLFKSL